MTTLHLVIGDPEEDYVEALVNYLSSEYSFSFKISYFTEEKYLFSYLSGLNGKVDILLISPIFYNENLPWDKVKTVILLTDGYLMQKFKNCYVVNKYQRGDNLAARILSIYSEANPDEVNVIKEQKTTKIIGVYSPIGGIGKTSIAIGLSMICAEKGLSVFYLNFEDFQSTPIFFDCISEENISHILFFLKAGNKNLGLKIEGVKIKDSQLNISYFAPPESLFEFDEITPEEFRCLIHQMKQLALYDVIFVDMAVGLNTRNQVLFEICNEVLLIVGYDEISKVKIMSFRKELELLLKRRGLNLDEKLIPVLNKYNPHRLRETEIDEFDIFFKIPEVAQLTIMREKRCFFDPNSSFIQALGPLVDRWI